MKAIKINILGKVQGVGFRYFVQMNAIKFSIKGFAKNLTDGSVYIEAEGNFENLDKFISIISIGNKFSKISSVNLIDSQIQNFKNFSVL